MCFPYKIKYPKELTSVLFVNTTFTNKTEVTNNVGVKSFIAFLHFNLSEKESERSFLHFAIINKRNKKLSLIFVIK